MKRTDSTRPLITQGFSFARVAVRLIGAILLVTLHTGCATEQHLKDLKYWPDSYTYSPLVSPVLKIDGCHWYYIGSDEQHDWVAFKPEIGAVHSLYKIPRGELSLDRRFDRTIHFEWLVASDPQIPQNPSARVSKWPGCGLCGLSLFLH